MTYKEDKPYVVEKINALIKNRLMCFMTTSNCLEYEWNYMLIDRTLWIVRVRSLD